MLSMMEKQKKLILFYYCFLYVFYYGARQKTHCVITLFFAFCLWRSKRKNSFCDNIIFSMLCVMKEEEELILLSHYFLYFVYDIATQKAYSVVKLFFLSSAWWSMRKNWLFYNIIFLWCQWWGKRENSFSCQIIFCVMSMMEQEKKVILLSYYFLYNVYNG